MKYKKENILPFCVILHLTYLFISAVIPDNNFGIMLAEIFGLKTHVFRKYQRMMYWMPKMKNLNPYPIPLQLPVDPTQLAVIALRRMGVDLKNEISVYWVSFFLFQFFLNNYLPLFILKLFLKYYSR